MNKRQVVLYSLLTIIFVCSGATAGDVVMFDQHPLYFIENQGQVHNEAVHYYIKGADKTLYFTNDGIMISLAGEEAGRWNVKLEFLGADPGVVPRGEDKQEAMFSYFKGKPKDWKTGLPTYSRVVYENLWPGIDLVYAGTVNRLKYEFIVKPGADPSQIRLAYCGAEDVRILDTGALAVSTPVAEFKDGAPYAYQTIDGNEQEVSMAYQLESPGEFENRFTYSFQIGAYDKNRILVLDPVVIIYCGYIKGSGRDEGQDLAVDDEGNVYLAGETHSDETGDFFPTLVGPDLTYNGSYDAFVAKVLADGSGLAYCGYIGGSGWDRANGVAVDDHGCAYIAGWAGSDETSFPVYQGPFLSYNGGLHDAFTAKVTADGSGLIYCGYIGGTQADIAYDIAVDNQDKAYITGVTYSGHTTGGFPVVVGPDLTGTGSGTAFVARLAADGLSLDYCGYIGGTGYGNSIAVNDDGEAFVAGTALEDENYFPVKFGPDLTYNGGESDAFVAKLYPDGSGLSYCGYIGGEDYDYGFGIAVDANDHAYVTGATHSDEISEGFPVLVGPDLTHNRQLDGYLAKVSADGSGLVYCGYIGGTESEIFRGVAVNDQGFACVSGYTESDENSFPVKVGPGLTHSGEYDAIVAAVNHDGSDLVYCGYIGGIKDDYANGIALDEENNVFITGYTGSDETSFPVVEGPDLVFGSSVSIHAFVAKISLDPVTYYVDIENTVGPWTGSKSYPFRQIQDGIHAAWMHDTIWVSPGTYQENLDFLGKGVDVKSQAGPETTVIDGGQAGPVVIFENAETRDAVLDGFTLTNGSGWAPSVHFVCGGGIFCDHASPTIINNIIRNNTAHGLSTGQGGGVCFRVSGARVENNRIFNNSASGYLSHGGGIYTDSSTTLISNIIHDNSADTGGGGIYLTQGGGVVPLFNNMVYNNSAGEGGGILCDVYSARLLSNTVYGNTASVRGGGVYCSYASPNTYWVYNNIIWNNSAPQGGNFDPGAIYDLYVTNNDIEGGWPGTGNIDSDPLFLDAASGDLHLTRFSPCIDAGDAGLGYSSLFDFEGDPRIAGAMGGLFPLGGPHPEPVLDMGADEFYVIKKTRVNKSIIQ